MENQWVHETLDASKMWAATLLGWVSTPETMELVVRSITAVAVCAYMIAKAIYAWRKLLNGQPHKDDDNEADT